ncbi:accessory gene regulator B family protein [Paenibacillus lautus]|uniref:accessory gene regulator ArgB-like protein n=1 Tax=Paenibacillus lautus TaxID=1401 RepID=UPI003D28E9D0
MIERAALWISEGIKRQVPEHPSSVGVLKHAIAILLNILCIVTFTLVISIYTGHMKQAITGLIGFALLRQFSGGIHVKTGAGCIVITTALFTAVSFVDLGELPTQILNILSFLLVVLFAPSKIAKQSRIPRKHYPKLRLISCIIVGVNFFIQSPTLSIVFFIQALSLIHLKGGESSVGNQQI